MAASSSFHRHSHGIWFLLPLVTFLLSSDATALKSVSPGEPALNVSLSPCERIRVSGYSRTKLGKYSNSIRLNLAPILEKLHSKVQVCVHRNASLSMCGCEKSDWKNLQKGKLWSYVMSPYDKQYIDVRFSGSEWESSGSMVTINVAEDFQKWRIVSLVAGVVLILLAPVASSWLPFYYTSSMAIGVFLVILVIIFQVMKLLPTGRKNVMYLAFYGSVVGAGSFILHQFSMMVNMILVNFGLSEDMYNPVAIMVLVGIVISGAAFGFWTVRKFVVSKEDGGGVDASVAQFVKWAMRSVAATFILQSSLDTPLAMGALVSASFLAFFVSKMKSLVVQRHWLAGARAVQRHQMRGRAEFLSRPGGAGLWKNVRTVPSFSGSPSYGVISPSSVNRRTPIKKQDYYSTYHRTPNRQKMSKEEYEELTQETTREAMAGLAASPVFSDWLIEHADRIKMVPSDNYDDELASGSDSTGEQSWTGFFW